MISGTEQALFFVTFTAVEIEFAFLVIGNDHVAHEFEGVVEFPFEIDVGIQLILIVNQNIFIAVDSETGLPTVFIHFKTEKNYIHIKGIHLVFR